MIPDIKAQCGPVNLQGLLCPVALQVAPVAFWIEDAHVEPFGKIQSAMGTSTHESISSAR